MNFDRPSFRPDDFVGRTFGMLGMTSTLPMLTGTMLGGALGGLLSPILLLTIQGGSHLAVGLLALALHQSHPCENSTALCGLIEQIHDGQ